MSEKTTAHLIADPVRKWLVALRTQHWIKSGFCLTALFFHGSVLEPAAWMAVLPIALCFCLISSAVYLANDIVNRAEDRRHPRKCRRPIASGQISVRRAWLAIVLLAGGSLGFAWWFYGGGTVTGVLAGYYLLSWIYSYYLRGLPLLDVLVLATGFVARVAAGAYALQRFDLTAHPTGWLLSCTYFLALLLGFGKRKGEWLLLNRPDRIPFVFTTLPALTGLMSYLRLAWRSTVVETPERLLLKSPGLVISLAIWILLVSWFTALG